MSEPGDDLAVWRDLLEIGDARAIAALARALREDPALLPEVVPLAFSRDANVRANVLRVFARVSETDPRLMAPFMPTILDAAAQGAAQAGAETPEHAQVHESAAPLDAARMQITLSASGNRQGRDGDDPPVEGDTPHLLYGTLHEMFQVLLATGWTPDVARAPDPYHGWKALPIETMEDVLEGVVYLLEVLYRDGDHERPWSPAELFEILLKRAIPLAIPLVVHKVSDSTAVVEAGAPQVPAPDGVPADSWPSIVGPFVQLLGHYVHPGFTFVAVQKRTGGPDHTVRFLASTAGATPRTS